MLAAGDLGGQELGGRRAHGEAHFLKPVATQTFDETGSCRPTYGTPSTGIWSCVAQRSSGSRPKRSSAQALRRS